MCFSATVSYSAAALLVPAGLYGVRRASDFHAAYWMIALVPLLFGIQQGFEGQIWLIIDAGDTSAVRRMALSFMFFSHLVWLVWIPLSSYLLENECRRRRLFKWIAILGFIFGMSMYVPLLVNTDWLSVYVQQRSIFYETILVYDEYVPRVVVQGVYSLIVLMPLLYSTNQRLRTFGVLIALSMTMADMLFNYSFISVWCYFSAVLSLYIIYMIEKERGTSSVTEIV
jgi:hypothetical protein